MYLKYVVFVLLIPYAHLFGSNSAQATVTYTIGSVDSITVSGNPGNLNITAAVAGSALTNATDATTTYSVTTNNSSRKIYGSVASAMPTGVTLDVSLTAPTGGSSSGNVALTTTAAALVTSISNIAQAALGITYTLSATLSASQVSGSTNTITYTIGP